jgi:hypothetical protein
MRFLAMNATPSSIVARSVTAAGSGAETTVRVNAGCALVFATVMPSTNSGVQPGPGPLQTVLPSTKILSSNTPRMTAANGRVYVPAGADPRVGVKVPNSHV